MFSHLLKFSLAAMILALSGCYYHDYDDDDGWRDRDRDQWRHEHRRHDRYDRYDRDHDRRRDYDDR